MDAYLFSSAVQKAVRRSDAKLAGYFALEMLSRGYGYLLWKRLLTISAEDCYGCVTKEIKALFDCWQRYRKEEDWKKGRIFVSKAVIILCQAKHCRDADHLQNYVYDKKCDINDEEIEKFLQEVQKEKMDIPEYAYDCHTLQGKRRGKTKKDFFKTEYEALENKQPGLFDYIIEKEINSNGK